VHNHFPLDSPSPIISIQHLTKRYADKIAVDGISLDIEPGQIIGYIGPNGAGKSTTIKILTGIITEFEGDIRIAGMDIRKEPESVKRKLGYVPEQAALYDSLTAIEYLEFIARLYDMDAGVAAEKSFALLRLFGLEAEAYQRMTGYSKGMRQKVLLIAGLMHNPDILFLDEPLSGLDANAVILVKEILQQLKLKGKTIFYSSHMMDVVEKLSDRIILIHQGRVMADGNFDTLKRDIAGGTLEKIFSQLTGDDHHLQDANTFIQTIAG
jgi:ABC-2 type transport system ATP-binding protein